MTESQPVAPIPLTKAPSAGVTSIGPVTVAILMMILFAPSAVFYLAETTSMAPGILMVALAIIGIQTLQVAGPRASETFKQDFAVALVVAALLLAHLVVRALVVEIDVFKAAGSLMIVLLAIAACGATSTILARSADIVVRRAALIAMAVFLLSAVFSLIGVQPASETRTSKPIFPFTEPSHFAGALLPVLAFLAVTSRGWQRWGWILTGFALGYLLENLSLVVGSLLVTVACLAMTRLVLFCAAAVFILPFLDLTYFIDRIQFGFTTTTNLSSLVYIQGWELIRAAINDTLGWGVGFQQLGYTWLDAPTADLIYRLNGGSDLNLKEGSFGLAKLVTELGMFGLIIVVFQGFLAGKALLSLRRIAVRRDQRPLAEVMAMCSIYTFVVDMYVRGTGYFSGPAFLAVTSAFLLNRVQSIKISQGAAQGHL